MNSDLVAARCIHITLIILYMSVDIVIVFPNIIMPG